MFFFFENRFQSWWRRFSVLKQNLPFIALSGVFLLARLSWWPEVSFQEVFSIHSEPHFQFRWNPFLYFLSI